MFHEFIMQVGLKKISGKLSTQNTLLIISALLP